MSEEDLPPDPNAGLFGNDRGDEAPIVIVGVPWEPTVSYGRGASQGPAAIVKASHQLDFFHYPSGSVDFAEHVQMQPIDPAWIALNRDAMRAAEVVFKGGCRLQTEAEREALARVNVYSTQLNRQLKERTAGLLQRGKRVGIVGGDHSSPFGAIQALLAVEPELGILHIDAHADLRVAYEGFKHSHASIMYNLLQGERAPSRLVSVGVRDFSEDEHQRARDDERVVSHYMFDLNRRLFAGETWDALCDEILADLPERVHVSFDIDGLDPTYCPGTGTPVPGGLRFDQAVHLLHRLRESDKHVVGFDLCEVAPGQDASDEYDANVGARVLFELCSLLVPPRG